MNKLDIKILPKIKDAYIVGGSIRDLIIGKIPFDYDIAVIGNPEKFAKKIAANKSDHIIKLGKKDQKIIRVISNNKIFDISQVNGDIIEDDLLKRDFTINAMAYSLSSEKIIDCAGGMKDLAGRKIRMVSDTAFENDPVRLIRAYRIGAALNFEIEAKTVSFIRKNANLIKNSAGERIRSEMFRMLQAPESHHYISQMADTGLLFAIFPELGKLKGCSQNKLHQYDVFDHTMKAFYHLEKILNNYSDFLENINSRIIHSIDENTAALLKFAILLHDTGKPRVKKADSEGNVRFYGHSRKGVEITENIASRIKLSTKDKKFIDFIIRNHVRPLHLFIAKRKGTLTNKGITRFFITCGDITPCLLLHSIADMKGKGDKGEKEFIDFAKNMISIYFLEFMPRKKISALITGNDLINEFGLSPSPLFKKILSSIEEARLLNQINTKQEALALVKDIIMLR
ncbi:MAG: HD domain-containing protein [Proteobacteria bacterium]|nr:CCA tRNA nucleotidyltransferase [Desulfobacteraceae bacterium]MBU3980693.1 HD domain-containing protein [Pseudomonadota bacterium]MBU4012476.1 HD domain-containing protein [Pseudomonadota bacterium]MBU4069006.1 HD domain-containing protein [Pseudomonadota bacterium]MBU4101169.1 HD domain-containing protein [Pseudomonadota bacterium]